MVSESLTPETELPVTETPELQPEETADTTAASESSKPAASTAPSTSPAPVAAASASPVQSSASTTTTTAQATPAASPSASPKPVPTTSPATATSTPAVTSTPEATKALTETTPASADLASFYQSVQNSYEFGYLELADQEILDNFYPGLTGVSTEQRLVYVCMMSVNNGEFALVQVSNSSDVSTVKSILQARVDQMVDGGAWYPEATEQWENNSRVVSNGNYVMMVVHENADDIVSAFNKFVNQ
jgi:predicted lipid-binding transport protein (Tim44 family)